MKKLQQQKSPWRLPWGFAYKRFTKYYFSPFSIFAFNSARASMSPNVVPAAMLLMAGVSSFLAFLRGAF